MRGVTYTAAVFLVILGLRMAGPVSQVPATPTAAKASLEDQFRDELRETFGAIAIMDVTKDNQELRIKTGLPVISDEAYRRLLIEVCAIMVTKPDAAYEAVRFVNGIEKQGFVYKAPAECQDIIGQPEKEGKKLIFARTEFCRGRC